MAPLTGITATTPYSYNPLAGGNPALGSDSIASAATNSVLNAFLQQSGGNLGLQPQSPMMPGGDLNLFSQMMPELLQMMPQLAQMLSSWFASMMGGAGNMMMGQQQAVPPAGKIPKAASGSGGGGGGGSAAAYDGGGGGYMPSESYPTDVPEGGGSLSMESIPAGDSSGQASQGQSATASDPASGGGYVSSGRISNTNATYFQTPDAQVSARQLSAGENGSKHNLYVNAYDAGGNLIHEKFTIVNTGNNTRQVVESGGNAPIYSHDRLDLYRTANGKEELIAKNITTRDGDFGPLNEYGHHSFQIDIRQKPAAQVQLASTKTAAPEKSTEKTAQSTQSKTETGKTEKTDKTEKSDSDKKPESPANTKKQVT